MTRQLFARVSVTVTVEQVTESNASHNDTVVVFAMSWEAWLVKESSMRPS
jgi:hypothetical protein